jgi:hypothetical protein
LQKNSILPQLLILGGAAVYRRDSLLCLKMLALKPALILRALRGAEAPLFHHGNYTHV